MSFNGSGSFLINTAGQPVVSGTVISSTAFNALTADLATGLSTCITKDGQTTVTANIPMANYKFTGLGAGSAAADSANLSQVQSTVVKLLASVSGTDTITAVGSPTVAVYAAGQMFYFVAAGDNTGAVTINIDSLGAKAVTRDGSVALAAGDIKSGEVVVIVYDGTRFQVVSQLNSSGDARFANVSIASALNVGGVATVTGGSVLNGGVVINEPGADVDFRVEGDTDANLIFADASADKVGIGTSSPGQKLVVAGNIQGDSWIGRSNISAPSADAAIYRAADNTLAFSTASTERARITSGGDFCINGSNPLGKLDVYQSANARAAYLWIDNGSNTSNVLRLDCTRNTTNSSYEFLLCAIPGVATRLAIADSGNVSNTNGTYGSFSDVKLKTDIIDANSQWNDVKAIRFRKFKLKNDATGMVHLGVVAQELEEISPGLVEERADRDADGNDLGTTTKSVKTSILLMKAAVALQEAMARIEKLEAEMASLKGA